jgi:hypothetical protein
MTYRINGETVTMILSAAEITAVIESLELTDPDSSLLSDWQAFRKEEFASTTTSTAAKKLFTWRTVRPLALPTRLPVPGAGGDFCAGTLRDCTDHVGRFCGWSRLCLHSLRQGERVPDRD